MMLDPPFLFVLHSTDEATVRDAHAEMSQHLKHGWRLIRKKADGPTTPFELWLPGSAWTRDAYKPISEVVRRYNFSPK